MEAKQCSKCKIFKIVSEFHKCKAKEDGLNNECKTCINAYKNLYRKKNAVISRGYQKKYRETHKEKIVEKGKLYYIDNKEKITIRNKNWLNNNRSRVNEYQKKRKAKLYNEDPLFKITCRLRQRLYGTVKNKKSVSALELLGCTVESLKEFLEKQFVNGMSWENYGKWHIDHIIPCSSYNLLDLEQQKICFHYTNLRPLWAKENHAKNKYLDITDLLYGDVLINIFGADDH